MTDKQVENYLSEIHRVLKPKGRCLATFFILNENAKHDSNAEFLFPYDYAPLETPGRSQKVPKQRNRQRKIMEGRVQPADTLLCGGGRYKTM